MSKENKNETVVRANFNGCPSISVTLRENGNMLVKRDYQIVYDGIYDSEVLQQILLELEITSSSDTTDSIVSLLDALSPSEQPGYGGCLIFCFLVLAIVVLVYYGIWLLVIGL